MKQIILFVLPILAIAVASSFGQGIFEKQIDLGYTTFPTSITQSTDGSFYISGYYLVDSNAIPGTSYYPFITKTSELGEISWTKRLTVYSQDKNILIPVHDGGVVMASNLFRLSLIRFDTEGAIEKTVALNLSGLSREGLSVCETFDHHYIFASTSYGSSLLSKIDSLGQQEWTVALTKPYGNKVVGVIQSSDSNYILCSIVENPSPDNRIVLVKISPAGAILWNTIDLTLGFFSKINALTRTSDGGFAICGLLLSAGAKTFVAKFNTDGKLLWHTTIDAFSDQQGIDIVEKTDGDLALVGTLTTSGDALEQPANGKMVVSIIASDGSIKSLQTLDLLPNYPCTGVSVTSTKDNGIVILGSVVKTPIDRSQGTHAYPQTGMVFIKVKENAGVNCFLDYNLFISQTGKVVSTDTTVESTNYDFQTEAKDLDTVISVPFRDYDICSHYLVPESELHNSDARLHISPSPLRAGEALNVHLNEGLTTGNYELNVTDLLGNTLLRQKIAISGEVQDIHLSLSNLVSGVYVLELRNEAGASYHAKFVRE
ncbi:MAG: T9SS type A sorting domain-containing protein [Bacteroidota bacterium]|nr:T9SS type A sorting domain-containing protein [Bacteroidota bacterium]MDP4229070.1 T9SS type A sorting domain-containing protein [Bacteroidota bacterium]